jgi:hypothetical protein
MGDSNRLEAIIATSSRLLALPRFAGLDNGTLKPLTEEEADRLTLAQKVARMEQIGDTCIQIDTYKRDFILAHAGDIRSFLKMFDNQGKSGPALTPDGQPIVIRGEPVHTKKRAVRLLFNSSLGYIYENVYPKGLRPREGGEAKEEGDGKGEVVDAEVVKVPTTVSDWLTFFARLTQEQRQAAYEAITMLMDDPRGDDPDHAAGYGVALDCAEDNAVDYEAFRPAVPVGDGNGCEPQQEEVTDCKVPVPGQEAHGTDSLEVTETADSGSLPCATPGHGKRAKHPPVPIVLEDGRSGHVIAGMGKLTKRTRYDVRLETGERLQVPKKAYGTPASLKGLSLVPKAWLVDGEVSLDQVPDFLGGQVPATESEGMEY